MGSRTWGQGEAGFILEAVARADVSKEVTLSRDLNERREQPCECLGEGHFRQRNGKCKGPEDAAVGVGGQRGGPGAWPLSVGCLAGNKTGQITPSLQTSLIEIDFYYLNCSWKAASWSQ